MKFAKGFTPRPATTVDTRPGDTRPGDTRPTDTRGRILTVALGLIADKGFAATSTRELSEQLGFTKAALYYHFRTKDDLLVALAAPVLDDLAALVDGVEIQPAIAARRSLLAGYMTLVVHHEAVIRVLSKDPSVAHRPALETAGQLYEKLIILLAGHPGPDTAERVRGRAALGGIHAALLHPAPNEDPEVVRQATLVAACGALGIPPPTSS